jgi:hypothetical protein
VVFLGIIKDAQKSIPYLYFYRQGVIHMESGIVLCREKHSGMNKNKNKKER